MKKDSAKKQKCEKYLGLLALSILFIAPFYFVRVKIGWLSFSLPELFIIIFILGWILLRNDEKKLSQAIFSHPFLSNKYYFSAIIFIVAGVILSSFSGGNYYAGLGTLKGWFLLPILFAYGAYDLMLKNEKLARKYFLAVYYSGACLSLFGLIYFLGGRLTYDGRLNLFYDSPNQLAMTLAPAFLAGAVFSLGLNLSNLQKVSLSSGSLLIALNIYLTKSYGAWFAVIFAIIVIFWLKYRNIWQKRYLAGLLVLLLALVGWAVLGKYKSIKGLGNRSSLDSRVMIWKSALLIGKDNPVLGIGPGNFQSKYLEYQKYFPPYLEWSVPQPHNLYLTFWLEAGLLGLFGFLELVIKFLYDNIKKAFRSNPEMASLSLAIMLYFLLHGFVDTTYWKNDSAMVFWTAITINLFLAGINIRKKETSNP